MSEAANNETESTPTPVEKKRNRILTILSFIFLVAGGLWILNLFFDFNRYETTNNAQVEAYISSVASRANGYIKEIRFESNQWVHKGDTLVILDDEEYRIKVAQAEADLAIAQGNLRSLEQSVVTSVSNEAATRAKMAGDYAKLQKAEKDYQRFKNMIADSAVTQNQYDQVVSQKESAEAYLKASEQELLSSGSTRKQTTINLDASHATVDRKKADLEAAKLQLSYTIITAPIDGYTGERTISPGQLVTNNQIMVDIVMQHKIWVTANFKETQVEKIKPGQEVNIYVDALDDKKIKGKVLGFSPATGAKFSMVEPDNSTGNFVKITQRIPVKIQFDVKDEELKDIKPGMNVTVEVIQ